LDIAKSIVANLPSSLSANVSENGFINFTLPKEQVTQAIKKKKQKKDIKSEKEESKPIHILETKITRSIFIEEEFELYCKYQLNIHKDDKPTKKVTQIF